MLLRAFRPKRALPSAPAHKAEAHLPVKLGRLDAQAVFGRPVDRRLRAMGLGEVMAVKTRQDADGRIEGVELVFALVSLHPRALRTVGTLLEELDAPLGSSITFSQTGARHIFGRTEGLGLVLDPRDGVSRKTDRLAVLEACTDALEGQGLYQGSNDLGENPVLYFYGDSFNAMKNALASVMRTEPRCRHAYTQRLT